MDDVLLSSPSPRVLSKIVEALKEDLTRTSTETILEYLGMNLLKSDNGEICLSAEEYAEKMGGKF